MKATLFLLLIMVLFSCKKEAGTALTTSDVTDIAFTTASCGGFISYEGPDTVLTRGVCWAKGNIPTIADSKTTDGTGSGTFLSLITGLTDGTTYHVRAYATNNAGTSYGNTISFTTQYSTVIFNPDLTYGTVTDIDGNVYKTIQIGTQTWMAENLKTTKYANGDLIGAFPFNCHLFPEETPKYQYAYNGNESFVAPYGRLYTWYAVTDTRKVCPTGWHVPSYEEWLTLNQSIGGGGGKLKETGTFHWLSPNTGATNETGFTALPGGYRECDGYFTGNRTWGTYSSSTSTSYSPPEESGNAHVYNVSSEVIPFALDEFPKQFAISVRCLKDY